MPVSPLPTGTRFLLPEGLDLTLYSIDMITPSTGWAIGGVPPNLGTGHVLRSEDGGHTWADVSPPEPFGADPHNPPPYLLSGHFFNEHDAIVVYGSSGIVWRTEDGGLSWTPSRTSIAVPYFFSFPTTSTGWGLSLAGHATGGNEGAFLSRTSDGGESWEEIVDYLDPYLQDCAKTGLDFVDDRVGWATLDCVDWDPYYAPYGTTLFLEATADGGVTWSRLVLPPPAGDPDLFAPRDEFFHRCELSPARLFSPLSGVLGLSCTIEDISGNAVRDANYLYHTSDGGAGWTTYEMPGRRLEIIDRQNMWSILPVPSSGLFRIYRSDDGGRSWAHLKDTTWQGQFDFLNDHIVFAIVTSGTSYGGPSALVRSLDGGASWEVVRPLTGPSGSIPQHAPAEIPPRTTHGTWTPEPSG